MKGPAFGALVLALALAAGAAAQYREYYLRGKVVDPQQVPIAGVEVQLRDKATSRAYSFKTDEEGVFKFAGLPRGVYEVTFTREGYASRTDEWKFEARQDRMQRVDVPDVVLVSEYTTLPERSEASMRRRSSPSRSAAVPTPIWKPSDTSRHSLRPVRGAMLRSTSESVLSVAEDMRSDSSRMAPASWSTTFPA